LGKILDDVGLERTCSMAILEASQDPLSDDPARRQGAVDYMRRLIERTASLGATVLCGPMYQVIGQFSGKGPTERELQRAASLLRAVADEAEQAGVLLALEPLNRFEAYLVNTVAAGAALVQRVHKPAVGLLYDTFHANIEEQDPVGAIRRHKDVIRHFHVSANDRGTPGKDHIDWPGTFAALQAMRYEGWLVVEAFGNALPGLAAATRIWRVLFESEAKLARDSIAFVRKQWKAATA
jgi:D-psicose/D-tagatose/L-ribulose 3-epimerase